MYLPRHLLPRQLIVPSLLLASTCCLPLAIQAQTPTATAAKNTVAPQKTDNSRDKELRSLVDEVWDWELTEDPLLATETADPRNQDRLPSETPSDFERRAAAREKFLERLTAIPREQLSASARADYEVLRRRLSDLLNEYRFKTYLMPVTSRSGFHVSLPELHQQMKLETSTDYRNYIARLNDFPRYFSEQIALMRLGISAGRTTPAIVLRDILQQLQPMMGDDPKASMLYKPFAQSRPGHIPDDVWNTLCADAQTAIQKSVVPSFSAFHDFLRDKYLKNCRGSIGALALPEGREFYRFRVQHFTTLELTPEEVHAVGLSEVQRIREEMRVVMRKTGFEGSLEEFIAKLRSDPQHYAKSADELMQYVALICKRIDGSLPQLFCVCREPRTACAKSRLSSLRKPRALTTGHLPAMANVRVTIT